MLAALVINLLAFALPLFTMNVYDRIIPNKSVTSLWVLAFGVVIAISVEFGLRLARTRLVDELGRALDARLSQRLFEKVLNLPMSEKKGSTGALARRVTDYEMVRDFFASTTVVLIVDIIFLFLFVALIAILAGWLALIPVVAIIVMATAGLPAAKIDGPGCARRTGGFKPATVGADRIDQRHRNIESLPRRRPDAWSLATLFRRQRTNAGKAA
jgi:ATP-binding cassette subfamily C protein LapB